MVRSVEARYGKAGKAGHGLVGQGLARLGDVVGQLG